MRYAPPQHNLQHTNKINTLKEMLVYPDFGHESLPMVNDKIFEYMIGLSKEVKIISAYRLFLFKLEG